MHKRTPLIALGATVAAAGAAALSPLGTELRPAPAGAQSGQSGTSTQAKPAREPKVLGTQEKEGEGALAKALGKSAADVHAARRSVLEDRLERQRSEGRITTAQGEVVLRAFDLYVPAGAQAGERRGPGAGKGPRGPRGADGGRGPRGGERPGSEERQQRRERRQERSGERRDEQESALAEALDVSVQELRDARAEVLDARLQQAQEKGRITEEQREQAVEAVRKGERPERPRGGRRDRDGDDG